jgi:hypothetical protein
MNRDGGRVPFADFKLIERFRTLVEVLVLNLIAYGANIAR